MEKEKSHMRHLFLGFVYLMFFLSGAAALMYQVIWVRSLSLVFGGSHLAVTAVLSVFMAGLALGGYVIGRYVDKFRKPLMLYGLLEIGIALFAVIFALLVKFYPEIYVFLARGKDDSYLYLTLIRIFFAVLGLIIPTTLMGGTLPVLSRFISRQPEKIRSALSFLYGFNTLGAVMGATAAGFFFLRFYSVTVTLKVAVGMNALIGIASLLIQRRGSEMVPSSSTVDDAGETGEIDRRVSTVTPPSGPEKLINTFPFKLVQLGAGISGFCALGYEILWTRILTVVIGASVYGFTTMLAAFLSGIALGSGVFGVLPKIFSLREKGVMRSIIWFGIVQVVVGATAIAVTVSLRNLPRHSILLQNFFRAEGMDVFSVRMWANFILAYAYMIVPAFFMGVAFPLAGRIHAVYRKMVGSSVGEILAFNTIGAIIGASMSGFLLIYLFGIERSLQMLSAINVGFGLLVILSTRNLKQLHWAAVGLTVASLLFLGLNQNDLRIWNTKSFATYRNNQTEGLSSPAMVSAVQDVTDIPYYAEGIGAIISVTKVVGGEQSMLVNGKVIASSQLRDQQVQLALGHLPMLLHRNPKKVLVVGLGSGMTLGATSVHPAVEKLTVVEIEPAVLGGARTFGEYNHHVLDNQILRIIFNDGRNFLLTTKENFDVITADPIHPWAQGASYLYTTEYFRMASEHLLPGGIMCQWLPIYELSTEDMKSVVKTFIRNFKHTMLWLTHYDAVLIGSNSAIAIEEEILAKRLAVREISTDLNRVMMGSAEDLLSYFIMGTGGLTDFSKGGIINTDDALFLEFSAPLSVGRPVMEANIRALMDHRESIVPYLILAKEEREQTNRISKWAVLHDAARLTDRAHALFLGNRFKSVKFQKLLQRLEDTQPAYGPAQFLKNEYISALAQSPQVLQRAAFSLLSEKGEEVEVVISALKIRISSEMTVVAFFDEQGRFKGQKKFPGIHADGYINRFANEVLTEIGAIYERRARLASARGRSFPPTEPTMRLINELLSRM